MSHPPKQVRFGIIGTGRITRRLVADLQSTDRVSVSCIASRTKERSDWFASQYGIPLAIQGYQQLIERDDVDAVYLSLPPSLHAEWCIRAAEAGKHVLCEKPLAMNVNETIRIHQACTSAGVRWIDATGWTHHERTKQMRNLVASGRLGDLGHVSASVSFHRPFQSGEHRLDPALGGGCILDLGWYAAGLVQYFAGPASGILADSVLENGVALRSSAMMWLDSRVSATLSCGYDTATRKWFEVAGSEASLICDDFTRPWADRPTRYWIHDASGKVESHEQSDHQEIRMIETLIGDAPLADYHQLAIETQAALDAWQESSQSGQRTDVVIPAF